MINLIFFGRELDFPGDYAGRANLSEYVTQMRNQNMDEDSDDSSSTDYVCLECK